MRLAHLERVRLPNQALQRTAATVLVCQGVKLQRLPRPLSRVFGEGFLAAKVPRYNPSRREDQGHDYSGHDRGLLRPP
jgi:hypothetical protein